MTPLELVNRAIEAREHAYVPYSHFAVGAALLTKDGKVYPGCNIENSSFGATNCAERTAFFSAVYAGEREFEAIAIVGGPRGPLTEYCSPCGVCRQVMQEFCGPDFEIHMQKAGGGVFTVKLPELLPFGFTKDSMEA